MSARASLSTRDLKDALAFLEPAAAELPFAPQWLLRMRAAVSPSPKKSDVAREKHQRKVAKRATKKEQTAALREQALRRADGLCECGCGCNLIPGHFLFAPEMDHAEGRRVPQRISNVWILAKSCHTERTLNKDTPNWIGRWIDHCLRYGYRAEAERTQARLEGIVAVRAAEASR